LAQDRAAPLPVMAMHSQSAATSSAAPWASSPATASATGKRRWCPTSGQDDEAVFMLTEYTCHDESFMAALGSHSKAISWTIEGGGRSGPVKIGLQMDKSMMGKAEILVTEGDRNLFPSGGVKANLSEDFVQRWNFCGVAAGMNEPQCYEVLIVPEPTDPASQLEDEDLAPPMSPAWHPCTLTKQLDDGSGFEVLVALPDGLGGCIEVARSPVNAADLRQRHTKKRIHVPWRYIKLEIPKLNPIQAALTADRGEPITAFFAMPTPAGPDALTQSTLTVRADQQRSSVHIDASATTFAQFMAHEAFRGELQAERSRKAWTLQLGPVAEHVVVIEKGPSSGVLRLSVDGKRVAESSAADLGCADGWSCNFRFLGKRILHFVVFETNRYGMPLDQQGTVTQESRVEHTCSLVVPSTFDLSSAHLQVNGDDFESLPPKAPVVEAARIHMAPLESLRQEYGILVPYKVNEGYLDKPEPIMPTSEPATQQHPQPHHSHSLLQNNPVVQEHTAWPPAAAQTSAEETPNTGLVHWIKELRGIWHACSATMRIPSEEGIASADDNVHSHSRSYPSAHLVHEDRALRPPQGSFEAQGDDRACASHRGQASASGLSASHADSHSYASRGGHPPAAGRYMGHGEDLACASHSSQPPQNQYAPHGDNWSSSQSPPVAHGDSRSCASRSGQSLPYSTHGDHPQGGPPPPPPPPAAHGNNRSYAPRAGHGQSDDLPPPPPPPPRHYGLPGDKRNYAPHSTRGAKAAFSGREPGDGRGSGMQGGA